MTQTEVAKTDEKVLIGKTYIIIAEMLEKINVFGKSAIVLGIIDVIFGLLALLCTSLTFVAFLASTASLTVISLGSFVVQTSKLRNLAKALKPVNLVAIAWFVNKYKKYLKKENKTMKTTKLSGIQIASIVGAVLGIAFAVVSVFVPQIAIAGDSIYNILIATGVEGLCALAGTFKGYKQLTEEQIAKIQDKKKAKENKALQVKAEKAQKELDRIEGLKAIVAEAEIAKQQEINK